jgi:hypothetical protein
MKSYHFSSACIYVYVQLIHTMLGPICQMQVKRTYIRTNLLTYKIKMSLAPNDAHCESLGARIPGCWRLLRSRRTLADTNRPSTAR